MDTSLVSNRNFEVDIQMANHLTIGSSHIVPCLDKLHRCTDRRRNHTKLHARSIYLRLHEGIGNVCAVPRQENLDAIGRSYTYVQSVRR